MVGSDRGRAHHHLGAVSAKQGDLLRGHLVGHDEYAPVAPACGHDREPDAGVPRRAFHDRRPGLQQSLALRLLDHRDGRTILDAPAWVQELELGEELARQVPRSPVEPDERGIADQVEKRFGGLYRRASVGERDHLHALEATGRGVDAVFVQLDGNARPVQLDRQVQSPRADDAHLSREPSPQIGHQVRERLIGGDDHNLVGAQRQPFRWGFGTDDHENVHAAMLP